MEDTTKGNLEAENMFNQPDSSPSSNIFEELEANVNGGIVDTNIETQQEVTPPVSRGPEQVTHTSQTEGPNEVDWEKRYKDSSRQAQKMYGQLKNLKPFVPVLEAMKNDSGLVQHVRDYLENGGAPAKSVQERLGLDEDFQYDQTEALEDPNSDSAKVFNAHVDNVVNRRVNDILSKEKQQAQLTQQQLKRKQDEIDFRKRHPEMTDEQYRDMMEKAKSRTLSLDDVYYLINKDSANQNVANATRQDMLNQMKTVRDIPASSSDANSQSNDQASFEDEVFNTLIDSDGKLDNLFG
tara:strand:- start:264 stop:1148 length:885 start_codon:yes stop_codon:yes gene_type:complete